MNNNMLMLMLMLMQQLLAEEQFLCQLKSFYYCRRTVMVAKSSCCRLPLLHSSHLRFHLSTLLVATVGDLHGDLKQARYALQMAGVLISDGQDLWTGGEMVLIQVGDILDRDEEEIAILSLLRSLDKQAKAKGGAVFQVLLRGPKNFREAVKHLGLLLVFFTAISSLMYDLREGSLRRLEEGRIAKDLGFKLYYFCIFLQFLVLEFEFEIYFVFEY